MSHEPKVEEAIEHILNGLNTDGAHHKQWDLEQALISLVGQERVDQMKLEIIEEGIYGVWEPGIP